MQESKAFSANVCCGNRGDRLPLGNMVEANTDSETLERFDGSGGHYHDYGGAALAGVPLWTGHRDAHPSAAAYLCLAFGWAHAYHIAALVDPSAFNAAGTDAGIVATEPVAHTLCSAEAETGQLYLAVLVARLVSMRASAEEESKQERSARRQASQSPD